MGFKKSKLDINIFEILFLSIERIFKINFLDLLRICSINKFVDNALPIMRWSEKYLGQTLFSTLARQTFYRHENTS